MLSSNRHDVGWTIYARPCLTRTEIGLSLQRKLQKKMPFTSTKPTFKAQPSKGDAERVVVGTSGGIFPAMRRPQSESVQSLRNNLRGCFV